MIRVLHVIHSLDPAAGGPPVIARQLAHAQSTRGLSVRLASVVGADTAHCRPDAGAVPVPASAVPPVGLAATLGLTSGPSRLGELIREAELVHLHGAWDPVLVCAARLARGRDCQYVVTPHGMLDPWCLAQSRWKKRLALAVTHRRMFDRAARLHLLNADEAALVRPLGLRAPVAVIPNGIAPPDEMAFPAPGSFRAARPEIGDGPYVLFLSRLHHKKGLDILAQAFSLIARRFPITRLLVAGPDDGAREEFETQVNRLGIADRVHLVGALYGPDKWAALRGSACFCLPSRQEGFSVAILEAMSAARPVVITENCHFPEVGEAGAGVVTSLDPESVAAGLSAVLDDPARAEQMGAAGRRLVETNYTWDRVAEQFEEVYRDILSRRTADFKG